VNKSRLDDATDQISIAVLMACHNRARVTKSFFDSIEISRSDKFNFRFYVTDDGSSDDTKSVLESHSFPIKITQGDGNLFWAKAMAKAEESIDHLHDGILWVNDDLKLFADAFENLFNCIKSHPNAVLVGQVVRFNTTRVIYGGYKSKSAHPLRLSLLNGTQSEDPDTFNGNFVYIPMEVRLAVGPINSFYYHAYADCDYGYRVRQLGYQIKLIPNFIGEGQTNTQPKFTNKWQQLKFFYNKKNNRLRDQIYFLTRFTKLRYMLLIPIFLATPFVKIIVTKKKQVSDD